MSEPSMEQVRRVSHRATDPEWYECEDCHAEAVFLHRYQHQARERERPVEFRFCDMHSLAELRRDLSRMQRVEARGRLPHPWVNDLIEVVLIPV